MTRSGQELFARGDHVNRLSKKCCFSGIFMTVAFESAANALIRRKPKGDGGKGLSKKAS